jgi:translation elongation factor EF-4
LQESTGKTYEQLILEALSNTHKKNKTEIIMEAYNKFLQQIYLHTTPTQQQNYENLRPIIRKLTENNKQINIQKMIETME